MAYYVDGAKRAKTRERRIEEMIAMLEEVASWLAGAFATSTPSTPRW
jgi:uncharacterized protein YdeI (YjbR/CyaY-like superfamily)